MCDIKDVKKITYLSKMPSLVGMIYIASDGDNIIGLWIEGQKYFKDTLNGEVIEKELPVFKKAKKWLEMYFNSEIPDFSLPIKLCGSDFRKAVWNILQKIPYGETISYGEIAKKLEKISGKRVSAQAVGGAVGHNPVSIIVPCHRVIGKDGSLTGYAGGLDKKIKLLEIEKIGLLKK